MSFTDSNYTWQALGIFMLYLNVLIFILSLLIRSFSPKQLINLVIFNIYFAFLFGIFKSLDLDVFVLSVILYYLFVAY
jgi:hypothetical protein